MTASKTTSRDRSPQWARARGVIAGAAALGFLAVAVAAPLTMPTPAAADAEFYERIHQQFVPELADAGVINVAVAPPEELPKPEPEPVVASPVAPAAAAAPPMYTGGGSPAEWMAAAGIPESDWGYVDYIASKESGWNPNATNASSGACGLIQAHPCSKVPGSGYNPVDNLRWANGYAVGRYGSWAAAYAFWTANHWW